MKAAALWVLWNLIFANFSSNLLPENAFRFAITMSMPALSALLFLNLQKVPIRSGINWGLGTFNSYLTAVLFPSFTAFLVVLLGLATGFLQFNANHQAPILGSFLTLVVWCLASLGEEVGWRGYLHNHLKKLKHAPLIVGLIWGIWHFHDLKGDAITMLGFTGLTVLLSYVLSWLVENGGTVLSCTVFHGFWNFLRLKILFGNPKQSTGGFFVSTSPQLTEMEGLFGLLVVAVLAIPFIYWWYQGHATRSKQNSF